MRCEQSHNSLESNCSVSKQVNSSLSTRRWLIFCCLGQSGLRWPGSPQFQHFLSEEVFPKGFFLNWEDDDEFPRDPPSRGLKPFWYGFLPFFGKSELVDFPEDFLRWEHFSHSWVACTPFLMQMDSLHCLGYGIGFLFAERRDFPGLGDLLGLKFPLSTWPKILVPLERPWREFFLSRSFPDLCFLNLSRVLPDPEEASRSVDHFSERSSRSRLSLFDETGGL